LDERPKFRYGVPMYCWTLLSGNTADVPILMGVTDDLAEAMRVCEQHLEAGKAFLGYIEAVRPAMSVHSLDSCYVRTGRTWTGRVTSSRKVRWEERDEHSGPLPLP
jgi:hypothetical protein